MLSVPGGLFLEGTDPGSSWGGGGRAEELVHLQRGPGDLVSPWSQRHFLPPWKETRADKPSPLFDNFPVYLARRGVPRGDLLSKLLACSVIFKSLYFPRNRGAALNRHGRPELYSEGYLRFPFIPVSELEANYLFRHSERITLLLPISVPASGGWGRVSQRGDPSRLKPEPYSEKV